MKTNIRPVRCFICKKRMFYVGEKRYEPEYRLYFDADHIGYVHQRCIRKKLK